MMLDEIAVFVQVVEAGSFTAAARKRAVPKSTLSRGVARLEDALRTPLLQRTARKVALTDAGRVFYERVAPHVAGLRDAAVVAGEREEQPRGTLRVTAPVDIGEALLADVFVRFAAKNPHVKLDVDLSARTVNLVEEGFDVAIRASQRLKDSTLVARKLCEPETHLYASPLYLARKPAPQKPEELSKHDCVLFRPVDGQAEWPLANNGVERHFTASGRLGGNEFSFVRSMLRAGAGVGPLPGFFAAMDVADGRLVRVLPEWSWGSVSIFIVYPGARHIPKKVTVFRDFLIEAFRPATPAR
ncbi:MAG: LysR family transcriptional regulator [Polyangiales bacterium]